MTKKNQINSVLKLSALCSVPPGNWSVRRLRETSRCIKGEKDKDKEINTEKEMKRGRQTRIRIVFAKHQYLRAPCWYLCSTRVPESTRPISPQAPRDNPSPLPQFHAMDFRRSKCRLSISRSRNRQESRQEIFHQRKLIFLLFSYSCHFSIRLR